MLLCRPDEIDVFAALWLMALFSIGVHKIETLQCTYLVWQELARLLQSVSGRERPLQEVAVGRLVTLARRGAPVAV